MAQDWLIDRLVNSTAASLQPVSVHGKFLRRAGEKFLLKGMRLPSVAGASDFNEKIALRKRLDELLAAHVNTLILTEAQAETDLGVAGQAGLCAIVEVAIDANDIDSPAKTRAATERVGKAAKVLRGYPALIGVLIDWPIGTDAIARLGPSALRSVLDGIVRAVRSSNKHLMVALKRSAEAPEMAVADEDFVYLSVAKIDPAVVGPAICALHDRAGARPLVIEFGEEFPGQAEVVAGALGFGVAGVIAPAMRPAVSPGWKKVRMLSAGELLPFEHLEGSVVPLPDVTPLVSVVVIARDDEGIIGACLESIGRLQYPNYEVIVIDDGSRDRSAEIAAVDPGVRLIRRSGTEFGDAHSEAVRAARGDLIAFTRADCSVDSDWLTLAANAIAEGGVDGCCGPTYSSRVERGFALRVLASLERADFGHRARQLDNRDMRNLVIRKSSLSAVGGFDSGFIDAGSGRGLSARLAAAGMTIGWCPAGFVWRCRQRTIGEFFRSEIRQGQADARLASKPRGYVGAANTESPRTGGIGRLRRTRTGQLHIGIVELTLTRVLSSMGAIARELARRHYAVALAGATASFIASKNEVSRSAHRIAIGKNHAHAAHPAGR